MFLFNKLTGSQNDHAWAGRPRPRLSPVPLAPTSVWLRLLIWKEELDAACGRYLSFGPVAHEPRP